MAGIGFQHLTLTDQYYDSLSLGTTTTVSSRYLIIGEQLDLRRGCREGYRATLTFRKVMGALNASVPTSFS